MPTRTLSARAAAPLAATVLALGGGSVLAGLDSLGARAAGAAGGPEVSATASPSELQIGAPSTLTGRVQLAGRALSDAPLALQSEPYPYRGFAVVAHTLSAADGSFAFAQLQLDRNTRLRVLDEDAPGAVSATLPITVDPAVALSGRELGPGRTLLRVRVRHLVEARARSFTVFWYTAHRGGRRFALTARSSSRELDTGVSYASAIVDPPAKHFLYRVCMNPPWEDAMGLVSAHGNCPQRDFNEPRGAH